MVSTVVALVLGTGSMRARAVILYSSATSNTSDPGDGSGWLYQGLPGGQGIPGTAIGPHSFIGATHVGGIPGTHVFNYAYDSTTYTIASKVVDSGSDLTIYTINGTFPTWAPLYLGSSEVGKQMSAFGKGVGRGSAVMVGSDLKGWQWLTSSPGESWGRNIVSGTTDYAVSSDNKLLYFDFDAPYAGSPNVANEGALTGGDSGGAVFVKDTDNIWKLAGINYAADGPWALTNGGTPFSASLFDAGGVYFTNDPLPPNPQTNPDIFIPDFTQDIPTSSYASRISANLAFIGSVVPEAVPEPVMLSPLAFVALAMCRRHSR